MYFVSVFLILCSLIQSMQSFRLYHSSLKVRSSRLGALKESLDSKNPVAVVTGASRGIGKAIAFALADAGCNVVINYASNEALANQVCLDAKQRAAANGGTAIALKADCSDHSQIQTMFSHVIKEVSMKPETLYQHSINLCSVWCGGYPC